MLLENLLLTKHLKSVDAASSMRIFAHRSKKALPKAAVKKKMYTYFNIKTT